MRHVIGALTYLRDNHLSQKFSFFLLFYRSLLASSLLSDPAYPYEKRITMTQTHELETTSVWQRIFLESKVNGALYEEQQMDLKWAWPEYTYLQRRLEYLRTDRPHDLWEPGQVAQKSMADAEVLEWDTIWGNDASLGNPIYVDTPLDVWYWCADPMSDGKNYAA